MRRRNSKITVTLVVGGLLAGCFGGKDIDLTCDEPKFYEAASDGPRIRAPEGLDELEEFKVMPVPEAAPAPPRPAGSPCVDRPPNVLGRNN